MKVENVLNCSFASWYPKFRKITAKSIVIPFPEGFVEYLKSDGIVLPYEEEPRPKVAKPTDDDEEDDNQATEDDVDWSISDGDDCASPPSFPEFDMKIKQSIETLGGKVFPKLNWSAPKDAAWIAMNNCIMCQNVSEIYLLFKSSDFIVHDLIQPFKFCEDSEESCQSTFPLSYDLILRKWIEIDPGTEYRCFVKNNCLFAISQRDQTNFYDHIGNQRNDITQDIVTFFHEHIKGKFEDQDFVFDVYRSHKDVVKLIDFNPFGEVTDALLFEWEELRNAPAVNQSNRSNPELRFVNINFGVQPSPFRHGMPRDLLDLSRGEDPYKLLDLLSLRPEVRPVDSSEDES